MALRWQTSLSVPVLSRAWQMLLKGLVEIDTAPDRRAAAEMVLIRLCHVADVAPPGELVRRLTAETGANEHGTARPHHRRRVADCATSAAVARSRHWQSRRWRRRCRGWRASATWWR